MDNFWKRGIHDCFLTKNRLGYSQIGVYPGKTSLPQLSCEAFAVSSINAFIPGRRHPRNASTCFGACVSPRRYLAAHLRINNQAGDLTDFGYVVTTQLQSFQPALKVRPRRQGGRLASVAGRVSEHEVVRKVTRVLGEGDEVVNVAGSQIATTVEATVVIELFQAICHCGKRLTGCREEEIFEVISFSKNQMVPWVFFDVVDPMRPGQLLHERVETPQTICNARLEPHFSGAGRS